ncbi:hypothetical protein C5167_009348 [Papaver somniferum]|uniref:RING-type domain-containing protein n=1 Tax=Papaver somniferum TaxID=3469 RepID=A0A4Y7JX52_PAPSO|nr:hypothetical protein C5167_009348 [Papaver somniferum]
MITRAITGQTTETGFVRGAGIGAVAGAIVAVELLESLLNGDSSSKVGTLETSYMEISDIFDVQGTRGMPPESVDKLPKFNIIRNGTVDHCGENNSCSICLQDFNEGETARELPNCKHLFHLLCIDGWLIIQASCPVCRKDV